VTEVARTARRWLVQPALVTAIIGLLVSSAAYLVASRVDEARILRERDFRVQWRVQDLQTKISQSRTALRATAIFMTSRPGFDPAAFAAFTSEAAASSPSVVSIAWSEPVTANQRAAFEAAHGVRINRNDATGHRVVEEDNPYYVPNLAQNRFDGRPPSLGFDQSYLPPRAAALAMARDTGLPKALLTPQFNSHGLPSYVVYWPIFTPGPAPASVAERRDRLKGYVYGDFRVLDVLNAALENTPPIPGVVRFFMSSNPDEAASDRAFQEVGVFLPDQQKILPPGTPTTGGTFRLIDSRSFDVLGERWRLDFSVAPAPLVAAQRSFSPFATLLAGLMLTSFVTFHLHGNARRVAVVHRLVAQRTAELVKANTTLAALIDASPFAIIGQDAENRIFLWNSAAERVFGYPAAEVIGGSYPGMDAAEHAEFEARLRRMANGETIHDRVLRRRDRHGNVLDVSSSGAAFHDSAGHLLGIVLVVEDITERNAVQAQLRQARKMEAVGQLTGGLAHDFNNLLGVVIGNLDLLEERVSDGETLDLVRAAIGAALRGAELTKRLLAFSRQQPLAPRLIALAPVLTALAQLLRRTLGEAIIVQLKLAADAWPLRVDVSQLESSLLNLAVNARDAMPRGGRLTIEIANERLEPGQAAIDCDLAPGDYVVIAVSDTGAGMSDEVVGHAFEPFFTTKGVKGTGLGLSMVHGFVKQSGGHTTIESQPDEGTTVRLYLPRATEDGGLSEEAETSETVIHGSEIILVVEDDQGMRELALRHLQTLGYRTLVASDGDGALDIIRRGTEIDLLFTDIVMPGGMDGQKLAESARRLRPGLSVLFTSGFVPAASARESQGDQGIGAKLLRKPYRRAELAWRVRAALDGT
jgi:PAS domain S-box-containing protein